MVNKFLLEEDIFMLEMHLKEQQLIKYYMAKHLTLTKIQNMMDINVDLLQRFINFLIKRLQVVPLNVKLCRTNH